MTKLTILYGVTSSGKTTLARKISEDTGAVIVDDFQLGLEKDTILVIPGNYNVEVIETKVDGS